MSTLTSFLLTNVAEKMTPILQTPVEDIVYEVLDRKGFPTRAEVKDLKGRLDKLDETVTGLAGTVDGLKKEIEAGLDRARAAAEGAARAAEVAAEARRVAEEAAATRALPTPAVSDVAAAAPVAATEPILTEAAAAVAPRRRGRPPKNRDAAAAPLTATARRPGDGGSPGPIGDRGGDTLPAPGETRDDGGVAAPVLAAPAGGRDLPARDGTRPAPTRDRGGDNLPAPDETRDDDTVPAPVAAEPLMAEAPRPRGKPGRKPKPRDGGSPGPIGDRGAHTLPAPDAERGSDTLPSEPKGRGRPRVVPEACVVEGCDRDNRSKGFCAAHYQTWRRGRMTDFVSPEGTVYYDKSLIRVGEKYAAKPVTVEREGNSLAITVDGRVIHRKVG